MHRLVYHLFRLLLITISVSLFLFLGGKEFAPSGTLTLRTEVGQPSPFFSRFLPDTRTEELYRDANGSSFVPIVGDPTYLTLMPPSDFDEVELELTYRNQGLPVVELGVLTNPETEAYLLQPLQHQILDELDWPRVRQGDVVLYDRHGRYDTLADFLVDPPPREEISAYHYQFDRPFSIPHYTPNSELRTLDLTLRGEHEFLTYIEHERLNFTFEYMDMNRTIGVDPVSVLVFNQTDDLVAGKTNEDDGDVSSGGRGSEMQSISLDAKLPDGVYKVILKVNRDIFFRRITTTQQKLTFLNQLFLGDEVGYQSAPRSVMFVTEAKSLSFETQHAEGVQTVNVAQASVVIEEPFVAKRHRVRAQGLISGVVPKGDVLMRGAGHYAFSREMYFNPDPTRLEWDTDLDALGIRYVIARYTSPEITDDLVRAHATFDVTSIPKMRDAWKFVLSLPGVYDVGSSLDVAQVKAVLRRDPTSVQDFFSRGFKKIGRMFDSTDL